MAIFQKILQTDSFLGWLTKWNTIADAMSPTGTGVLELNSISINGIITFGSASSAGAKSIASYDFDLWNPPKYSVIKNRPSAMFSGSKTTGILFNFDQADLQILATNRKIGISYSTETTGTGNIYTKLTYWVNKQNQSFNDTASGTSFNTIEVTGTSAKIQYNESIEIPFSEISDSSYTVLCKFERIGANILDTFNDAIYLYDIRIS